MVDTNNDQAKVLSSLAFYEDVRTSASNVRRDVGSNVDIVTDGNGAETAYCHLSFLSLLYPTGRRRFSYDSLYAVTLAVQDLNAGNGTHAPAVAGLHQRCPIRFTLESAQTYISGGTALGHVIAQTTRQTPAGERVPCAFLGAFASSVSVPSSMASGLLGYPQISGSSTSSELDNKKNHPLFGRTVPADEGNAIPLVLFFHQVLQIENLIVLNDNTSYGNAYAEAMRRAAIQYAPNMNLVQIPVDVTINAESDADADFEAAIRSAVQRVKATGFRYIFTAARENELLPLLREGYAQGIAGTGRHTWIGGDGFANPQETQRFEADDPLWHAYQGTAMVEFTGGLRGDATYDTFLDSLNSMKNPTDIGFMEAHTYPDFAEGEEVPNMLEDPTFLQQSAISGWATFWYEAAISLGLAACNAITSDLSLDGKEHYQALKDLDFEAISGSVRFDPETGSRDPTGLRYTVTNFVQETKEDGSLGFKPVITHLFEDSKWSERQKYIFNDGTTNMPAELPPEDDGGNEWLIPALVSAAALLVILGAVIAYFLHDRKRRAHDAIQKVKRSEIIFDDPPEVLGRGVFGLVLLAEYRGTKVATKQLMDLSSGDTDGSVSGYSSQLSSSHSSDYDVDYSDDRDGYYPSVAKREQGTLSTASKKQWKAGKQSGIMSTMRSSRKPGVAKNSKSSSKNAKSALVEDIMDEMKILSKLRHPCVTTFMGIVLEKESTPMLLIEYMKYGALYDVLHNKTVTVDGELILPILRDVAQGVRFLHSANPQFIHGDLKSANILLDGNFRAKVADFGLSTKKGAVTGTPYWMAPELLRKETENTPASDIFSFGVILYEVYARKDPYEGEHGDEVLALVADAKVQKRPGIPGHMPAELQSIMKDCLANNPERRPSSEEMDIRLQRLTMAEATPTNLKKMSRSSYNEAMPPQVRKALQDGIQVEPQHKDCISVFVCDIVGFDQISEHWSEDDVAALLIRFHGKLDEACKTHGVFRIKTTGVSYMAVANLFGDQVNDHTKRCAAFAKEALAVASQTLLDENDPLLGTVALRVGIHSGSAIAGVVGSRVPRYSLFGDTINCSMSMESTSESNRVSLSKRAADLLLQQDPSAELEDRGLVRISRKGKMHCYWLGATNAANDALARVMARKQSRMIQKGSLHGSKTGVPAVEEDALQEQAPPAVQESIGVNVTSDEEAPSPIEEEIEDEQNEETPEGEVFQDDSPV